MPVLPVGEYRPDTNDLNGLHTTSINNVVPRSDGYGPFLDVEAFTDNLPAACRGLFYATKTDGSVAVFAGTSTKLYLLDNTTLMWSDVSKGATTYSTLSDGANWTFAQFNSVVIACQANTVPQAFTLGSSSAFADLGGSPPQAAYVAVVNRFVVLSGLLSNPNRVQWSGLNAITTWTSGTTYSDYQDLPDGGNIKGVAGGEFGIIFQGSALRRMIFSPGSDVVFQIDRIAKDTGALIATAIVNIGERIFFLSTKGFMEVNETGGLRPIGKERVDRTFTASYDSSVTHLVQAAADPRSHRVLFAYKEADYNADAFNKMLAYDYALDRWSPIDMVGQFITSLSQPGLTLENLDTIGQVAVSGAADSGSGEVRLTVASTSGWTTGDYKTVADVGGTTEANGSWTITVVDGTHIDLDGSTFSNAYTSGGYVAGSLDDLDFSLDSITASTLPRIAIADADGAVGFFTGDTLEATVETSEQSSIDKRIFIRGMYPVTDAPTVYGSVGRRENLNAAASYTDETLINAQGFCPQRASTRHARAKLRIPAGTSWSYVTGAQPDFTMEGRR